MFHVSLDQLIMGDRFPPSNVNKCPRFIAAKRPPFGFCIANCQLFFSFRQDHVVSFSFSLISVFYSLRNRRLVMVDGSSSAWPSFWHRHQCLDWKLSIPLNLKGRMRRRGQRHVASVIKALTDSYCKRTTLCWILLTVAGLLLVASSFSIFRLARLSRNAHALVPHPHPLSLVWLEFIFYFYLDFWLFSHATLSFRSKARPSQSTDV